MTAPTPKLDAKTFWQYSVSRYTSADIAPLALVLQDNHGVNVNVLLLVCWCLENNAIINLSQLKNVIASTSTSEAKLVAHRALRKAAHPEKGGDSAHYEALKAEELALERAQQNDIITAFNAEEVSCLPPQVQAGNVFNASIAAFINAYGLRESSEARRLISLVVNQLP